MLSTKVVHVLGSFTLAALMHLGTTHYGSNGKSMSPPADQGEATHITRLENYITFKGPICQATTTMTNSRSLSTTSPAIAHLLQIALETKSVIFLRLDSGGDIVQAGLASPVNRGLPGPTVPVFQPLAGKDDIASYDVEVRYLQTLPSSNGIGYAAYVHIGGNLNPGQKPDIWIYTNYPIVGDVLELALKSGAKIQLLADGDGSIKKVHLPAD
jgi:hypothetical protein